MVRWRCLGFVLAVWLHAVPVARADMTVSFSILARVGADTARLCLARAQREANDKAGLRPDVVDRFRIAGRLPGDPVMERGRRADRSLAATLSQAALYALNGDDAAGRRAKAGIFLWLASYAPGFNPIDETRLLQLFLAIDLVRVRDAPAARIMQNHRLIRSLAQGYVQHAEGVTRAGRPEWHNNWQGHRIKIATLAAYLTGDSALVARAKAQFAIQVDDAISANGEIIDFRQRDAIHYVVYALEPLLVAALAAKQHGDDWYGAGQGSGKLHMAMRWLEKYASGDARHQEFVHTTQTFDMARKAAGIADFSGQFDPKKAWLAMALASRLDDGFSRWASVDSPLWLRLVGPAGLRCN